MDFFLPLIGFCVGMALILAALVVAIGAAVRRSSDAAYRAAWLFFVGVVLDLVMGSLFWQALGAIGS